MKKVFVLLAIIVSLSSNAAEPNEKILKCFATAFPKAENISWRSDDNNCQVSFNNGKIRCKLWYDVDGNILKTIRYYSVESLCPYIMAKLEQKHPDKKVFGITELSSDEGIFYYIILEDNNKWYHVTADGAGNLTLANKYKKA
ncbi:MAG TPA: hypothetical protein VGO09_01715 [Flavisolibacter sp.]|jgi:hypothetical protein|nr:hypothetical protein [Flavisolibacter sp.]